MKKITLLIPFAFLLIQCAKKTTNQSTQQSNSNSAQNDMIQKITGGSQKAWHVTASSSDGTNWIQESVCEYGYYYTFYSNGNIQYQCTNPSATSSGVTCGSQYPNQTGTYTISTTSQNTLMLNFSSGGSFTIQNNGNNFVGSEPANGGGTLYIMWSPV